MLHLCSVCELSGAPSENPRILYASVGRIEEIAAAARNWACSSTKNDVFLVAGRRDTCAQPLRANLQKKEESTMLILIIILVLVLGGGGGYYGHSRWGYGGGAGVGLGTILLILLIAYLLGILH